MHNIICAYTLIHKYNLIDINYINNDIKSHFINNKLANLYSISLMCIILRESNILNITS